MQNIGRHLKEDYEYSKKFFRSNELIQNNTGSLSIDDILRAHYLITDYFENDKYNKDLVSVYGLLNPNMLGSAYSRQFVEFEGKKKYNSDFDLCATLFYGLVKNHAFKDGNKRTALLSLIYHLYKKRKIPKKNISEFEELTVNVAADNYDKYEYYNRNKDKDDLEIKTISHFLKSNTRLMDSSYRSITFQELKSSLNSIGIEFSEPIKNFTDIYFYKKKSIFKGAEKVKIKTISCPGMKRQVQFETVKDILHEYKNKSGHEIDLNVIYQESEPMYRMIQRFERPFMRLKDK